MTFFLIRLAFSGIAAYLIGSVNPAIIISSKFYGSDIRKHGSGNAGMTNSFRVMGFKKGFWVMLFDLFKGAVAVLIGWLIAGVPEGRLIAVLCLVLGHCFPIFYGFKGGKGVLASAGAFLVLDWRMALSAIAIFAILFLIFKMVSLASIFAAASLPLWAFIYHDSTIHIVVGAATGLLLIIMHRSNIKRIINGTESKVGRKKEGS